MADPAPVSVEIDGSSVVLSVTRDATPEQVASALADAGIDQATAQIIDSDIETDGTEWIYMQIEKAGGGGQ